ncbi:MAG TPA: hypothetical protein H9703_06855, partial [Candidatus Faecalibacterium faecigallinarum]|nr:hypothetical protein [Candidatus Faecalibacterium faecigallinarum]
TALSARLTCPKPNARPIRHNARVPDRNGKIFYTSITSLSHISKEPGHETLDAELIVTILRKEKRDPDGAAGHKRKGCDAGKTCAAAFVYRTPQNVAAASLFTTSPSGRKARC